MDISFENKRRKHEQAHGDNGARRAGAAGAGGFA
jgi:hypothetical protein